MPGTRQGQTPSELLSLFETRQVAEACCQMSSAHCGSGARGGNSARRDGASEAFAFVDPNCTDLHLRTDASNHQLPKQPVELARTRTAFRYRSNDHPGVYTDYKSRTSKTTSNAFSYFREQCREFLDVNVELSIEVPSSRSLPRKGHNEFIAIS